MRKKRLLLFYLILSACTTSAQDSVGENPLLRDAEKNAIDLYYTYIGNQARLYNGTEHTYYSPLIKGHPYFLTDSMKVGSVVYDSLLFENVPMIYDVYKEELTVKHFKGYRVSLLNEKINEFNLAGHHFVRHIYDKNARSSLSTGFYDHVYTGKASVLVKREKLLDEKLTTVIEQEFLLADRYFIFKDGIYHPCNSFGNLLSILQEKKKIRRYLRKKGIRYKTNREGAIVEATRFYNTQK